MDVKSYLQEIRNERLEIRQLQDRIEELRMSLLPSAIRYDKPNVQKTPDDQLAKIEGEINEIETQLRDKLEALVERYNVCQWYIGQIQSSSHRQVLYEYYLNADRPSWDKVARKMDYSPDRIYQLHREAVKMLGELFEKEGYVWQDQK